MRTEISQLFLLYPIVWNGISFLIYWTTVQLGGLDRVLVNFSIFSKIPGLLLIGFFILLGFWTVGKLLVETIDRIQFKVNADRFQLERRFLGWRYQKIQGQTKEITEIELKPIGLSMNKAPITVCSLRYRLRQYRFGCFLTEMEKEWLVAEVREFLKHSRESSVQK